MNPYLAKLRPHNETPHPQAPSKPSKPGFEGFEGDRSRRISENGWIPKPVEDTPDHLPGQSTELGMNPYLAKLRPHHETPHPQAPSKPSKAGFEGFEGDRSRRISEKGWIPKPVEDTPFVRVFEILQSRCPDWVPVDRWQQCVEDGKRFFAQWGGHAEVFDWTARELFGLAPVPDNPH